MAPRPLARMLPLLLAPFVLGPADQGRPPGLEILVRARTCAPGEPMIIQVRSFVRLASLEGSFLGRDLFFVTEAATAGREDRRAWAAIDLGRRPGDAEIEVRGRTAEGVPVEARRSIRVLAKRFPTQTLRVEPKYVSPPQEVKDRIDRERRRLAEVYAIRSDAVMRTPFLRPVPGAPTSPFGARRVFNGTPRDPHPGLDLQAATGTLVRSPAEGRVAVATDLYFSGLTVILDHGGGLFTVFAHLSELAVSEGQAVAAGDALGRSGATGRVTGPHLHWGAKIGDVPVDPSALLDDRLWR